MSTRTYDQHCGLARSLDLLGERWTLLVVRELALGPRRYGDLADALPGIGTNLLAARLRSLVDAGVVRQTTLPPPAGGVRVYELTERGEELRGPLTALALWGFDLLPDEPGDATARVAWAALSMAGVADARPSGERPRGTFAFVVGDEQFHVTAGEGQTRVRLGVPPVPPVVTARMDARTFLALAARSVTPADAIAGGSVTAQGDADALDALFAVFRLPARTGAAA